MTSLVPSAGVWHVVANCLLRELSSIRPPVCWPVVWTWSCSAIGTEAHVLHNILWGDINQLCLCKQRRCTRGVFSEGSMVLKAHALTQVREVCSFCRRSHCLQANKLLVWKQMYDHAILPVASQYFDSKNLIPPNS